MEHNILYPGERTEVVIYNDRGKEEAVHRMADVRNVTDAIAEAYNASGTDIPKEDLVFEVRNLTRGTSARYRMNAHGHTHLIV